MARAPEPSAADLYARLGIAPDASTSQINTAYRRLARALHPDSAPNPGGSPAQLRLVIEAHRILSDPQQRQRYDSTTNRPPQPLSRSEPVTIGTSAVCRGTGTSPARAIYAPAPDMSSQLSLAPHADRLPGLPRPRVPPRALRRVRRHRPNLCRLTVGRLGRCTVADMIGGTRRVH